MAELLYVPRFVTVGAELNKVVDYLNEYYGGKRVIIAYQVFPADDNKIPLSDIPIFAEKKYLVNDPGNDNKVYNLGFQADHTKGTPEDPNSI